LQIDIILTLAEHLNHFIFDAHNEKIINKKLSNIKSIFRIKKESVRLKKLESELEVESEKLVEVNVNNVQLLAEVNKNNKLLTIAKKDIQNILNNLGQGFFAVNRDGIVQHEVSSAVAVLFQMDPTNRHLAELLRLEPPKASSNSEWVQMVFDEIIPFDDIKDLGEMVFTLNDLYIELDYRPIRDDSGKIEKIIVIATDKTKEKKYKERAEREAEFVKMILAIVKDRDGFVDFIHDVKTIFSQLTIEFNKEFTQLDIAACFRMAHTIKGNSGVYHLYDVQQNAHSLEDYLSQFRDQPALLETTNTWQTEIQAQFSKLKTSFDEAYCEIESTLGKLDDTSSATITRTIAEITNFHDTLQQNAISPHILSLFRDIFYCQSFSVGVARYQPIVEALAVRMEKSVHFELRAEPIKVNLEAYKPFFQSLIHAFRNALDHGIEYPQDRLDAGKPSDGQISVTITSIVKNDQPIIHMVIADDGRGINTEAVLKSAMTKQVVSHDEVQQLTDKQILQLLLRSGFSTRTEVTEWSGRGVGLDGIAATVQQLHGDISIETQWQKGTQIIIDLPIIK